MGERHCDAEGVTVGLAFLRNANRDALVTPCGVFRYWLMRRWSGCRPMLLFVMLNPSTADADTDDPTIRRCAHFAMMHEYGGFYVVNLFAFRATKPADLRRGGYQVGPDNDAHTERLLAECPEVCVAWGANAAGLERPQVVLPMIRRAGRQPLCLAITSSGYPQHPLMLPKDCRLRPFQAAMP